MLEAVAVNDIHRYRRVRCGAARRPGADHAEVFKPEDRFFRRSFPAGLLRAGWQRANQNEERHQQEQTCPASHIYWKDTFTLEAALPWYQCSHTHILLSYPTSQDV